MRTKYKIRKKVPALGNPTYFPMERKLFGYRYMSRFAPGFTDYKDAENHITKEIKRKEMIKELDREKKLRATTISVEDIEYEYK